MKIVVEFELSIDGNCSEEKAKTLFLGEEGLGTVNSAIISFDDSGEDFRIGIDSWEEVEKK